MIQPIRRAAERHGPLLTGSIIVGLIVGIGIGYRFLGPALF